MQTLFGLLFFVSLITLVVALINPSLFGRIVKKKVSRKTAGLAFGIATVVFFILIGVTDPEIADEQRNTLASSENNTEEVSQVEANEGLEETKIENDNNIDQELYLVTRVVDGDTIKVQMGDNIETLRLIGMDTPETVDPRKLVQCFGKEASNKAKEMLDGKKVRLEADITQGERDKYQRLLRYVFLEDGTFFNKFMIEQGYAHEYTYESNPYKYQVEFKEASKKAREGSLGLWSPNTCNGDTTQTEGAQNSSTGALNTPSNLEAVSASQNQDNPTPNNNSETVSTPQNNDEPQVKKSSSNICHERGSTYYARTKNYTPYNSIEACLASGGRLPKR